MRRSNVVDADSTKVTFRGKALLDEHDQRFGGERRRDAVDLRGLLHERQLIVETRGEERT